jgi:hypothetical protein
MHFSEAGGKNLGDLPDKSIGSVFQKPTFTTISSIFAKISG